MQTFKTASIPSPTNALQGELLFACAFYPLAFTNGTQGLWWRCGALLGGFIYWL